MLSASESAIAAREEVLHIESHVRTDLLHNEDICDLKITDIYHYVVYGTRHDETKKNP